MAICGACVALPRPGTGPGFSVAKRNMPFWSVPQRPNPGNLSSAGGSACQISTQASDTGAPLPARTWPISVIRSPVAPNLVRSAQSLSSSRCQNGPTVWLAVAVGISAFLHRRGPAPAQHHVEAIAERPVFLADAEIQLGDEPLTRGFVRHRLEHRVVRQQRIALEIHLGDEPRREGRAEIGEMNMVRPPGIRGVGPRVGAGPDGDEAVAALRVGEHAARPTEILIEWRVVGVAGMLVAAGAVGLPNLDHRVRHRPAVLVGDGA